MKTVSSVCPYCGVGCGVLAHIDEGRLTKIVGDPNHPTNRGKLCTKGSTLLPIVDTEDRLLYAHLRTNRRIPPLPPNR